MRLLMIVHGRVERLRESDAGVERPRGRRVERLSETSARHSFALCVLLVIIICSNSKVLISLLNIRYYSSHPYIFFNDDRETITFVGFIIDSKYNLVDPRRSILEARIMDKHLYTGLKNQGVNFKDDYRNWKKDKMIEKMSLVMGVDNPHDPDKSYVLTADNVIKILAIQMRFRCGIPVVIMGETGCGKTRLIRYMCDLAREGREGISNMLILKVCIQL